jgi:hypothetical protein
MTRSKKKWLREYRTRYQIKNLDDASVIEIYKTHKKLICETRKCTKQIIMPSFEGEKKVPFIIHRSAHMPH